jgi:hypothetical protein
MLRHETFLVVCTKYTSTQKMVERDGDAAELLVAIIITLTFRA